MNTMKLLNQFLAGVLIMVYHVFIGAFMNRASLAFIVSMYIFVLTMLHIVGMPIHEETGELQEDDVNLDFQGFQR